ncbi:hypothetical protein [Cellulosimicrobium marinum]|uniref:hypothetical protein n=1 Tax=Cellulosimicrobium marinum TaxID=1638992 RepID=UPI0027E04DE1|nr:hypothetical protein [Cellulosimicrobium marinum]
MEPGPAPEHTAPSHDHRPEPVSASMRRAKAGARAAHVTTGQVREDGAGRVTIECSCGMVLTNGPDWTVDEHIRLHRAEARYLALSLVAPAGMPRLLPVDAQRLPRLD